MLQACLGCRSKYSNTQNHSAALVMEQTVVILDEWLWLTYPVGRRIMKGYEAPLVLGIHVSSVLKEKLCHLHVVVASCQHSTTCSLQSTTFNNMYLSTTSTRYSQLSTTFNNMYPAVNNIQPTVNNIQQHVSSCQQHQQDIASCQQHSTTCIQLSTTFSQLSTTFNNM